MLSFLVIKTEFLNKSLNPVACFARSQFPACFLFWRRFVDIVIGGLMLVSRGYWMAVEVLGDFTGSQVFGDAVKVVEGCSQKPSILLVISIWLFHFE